MSKKETTLKDYLSKLTLKQAWAIISGIVALSGTAASAGYTVANLLNKDSKTRLEICEKEVKDLEVIRDDLKRDVLLLTTEVKQYEMTLEMMKQKDRTITPIIKELLNAYRMRLLKEK
jgi:hypothetical protein